MVKRFQAQVEEINFKDPVAAKLAAFMKAKRDEIDQVVRRAEELAVGLQTGSPAFVLCHADLHPGNLLIAEDSALYIVDWDAPLLAPKERDLALVGGCNTWNDDQRVALFYQGYGPVEVNRAAMAYYRYERVLQDIAAFCEQLLLTDIGGEDREQSYCYFASNFLPGQEIELARQADAELGV